MTPRGPAARGKTGDLSPSPKSRRKQRVASKAFVLSNGLFLIYLALG